MRLKLLFFLFLGLLVSSGAFIGYRNLSENKTQKLLLNKLPDIIFSDLGRNSVSLKSLFKDQPNVLIYFNSTCPICQSEADLIREVFSEEQNATFIWISSESVGEVKDFRQRYDFEILSNHTFLSDTLFRLASEFKLTTVPATLVYDSKGALVEFFRGAVSMTDLKDAINKAHASPR